MQEQRRDQMRPSSDLASPAATHTSYLICTSPRSGSDVLCGLLCQTGIAGQPDEFFYEGNEPLSAELDYVEYVTHRLATASTQNGVFGAVVMGQHFGRFISKLRDDMSPSEELPDARVLEQVLPNLQYVFLT